MKKRVFDEREINSRRKVASETFALTQYALLLAIIVQSYFMGKGFETIAAEFYIVMGSSFYIIIRNLVIGNNIFAKTKKEWKGVIITSLVIALTITLMNIIQNYMSLGQVMFGGLENTILTYFITFLSSFVASFLAGTILHVINRKRQDEVSKKYDE